MQYQLLRREAVSESIAVCTFGTVIQPPVPPFHVVIAKYRHGRGGNIVLLTFVPPM